MSEAVEPTSARAISEQDLLNAVPQPFIVLAPVREGSGVIVDFTFVEANTAACDFHQLPKAALVGSRLLALHPSSRSTGLFDRYVDIVENGTTFEVTNWRYPQDMLGGRLRYYDVLAVRVGDCVSQVWTDVTERYEAIEVMSQSEHRYRLLAENASDVVFMGSRTGVLRWLSANTKDLLGWEPADLIDEAVDHIVHADDQAVLRNARHTLNAGGPAKVRLRLRTAAGEYVWVAVSAKPLFGDYGEVIGEAGSWTDVSDLVSAREEAERQRAQMRATLDAQLDPFILLSAVRNDAGEVVDLKYVDANAAAVAYNQTTYEDLIGKTMSQLFPGLTQSGPLVDYIRTVETGEPMILDDYAYSNEVIGEQRRYDIRAVKYGEGLALTWRDVTDRSRAVEELAESERRYRMLAENASDVIWEVTAQGLIDWASESTPAVLGWQVNEVLARAAVDFVHPEDRERMHVETGEDAKEVRLRTAPGTYRWFELTARGESDGEGSARVVAFRDIDAEVSARTALTSRIGRDPLTGLLTRDRLLRRLSEEIVEKGAARTALLCIGLDSLSRVNDAYTHAAGDVVLVTIAERLLDQVEDPGRVARGTGAEFLVFVGDEAQAPDVGALAERIRAAAREPIEFGSHEITMTVSIGIASGEAGRSPAEMVRAATLAMRAAKDAGRDQVAFSTEQLAESARQWLSLSESVAKALHAGEFVSYLQPIHDLVHGGLCGFEALARWARPDGRLLGPGDFLPVAEHSDLITGIDVAMMRQSLHAMADQPDALFVSLNVSARSLQSCTYEKALLDSLRNAAIDPRRIHLEVTETDLLNVSEEVVARMCRIAESGIGWYIDDFGTGYSSISHLRDLPVRGIKLDVSFAAGIHEGEVRSIRLAQALAGLAQGLGLDTVAEGVETEQQLAILAAQGWRFGQGWLFGRPSPLP